MDDEFSADWDMRVAAMFDLARDVVARKGKPKPFGWDAVGKNEGLAEAFCALVEHLQQGGELPELLRPRHQTPLPPASGEEAALGVLAAECVLYLQGRIDAMRNGSGDLPLPQRTRYGALLVDLTQRLSARRKL